MTTVDTNIKLGDEVRDVVTGFTGIVTSEHKWLSGILQYGVQAAGFHDGKPIAPYLCEAAALVVTTEGAVRLRDGRFMDQNPASVRSIASAHQYAELLSEGGTARDIPSASGAAGQQQGALSR